jgi:hypothetical protein
VDGAFYVTDGDGFRATELTRGPWDPGHQHAGPPSALIGRAIEALEGGDDFHVGRVTLEIMRPVPIGPVSVEARIARPGRRVQMVEATMLGEDGEELIHARAWRIREAALDLPDEVLALTAHPFPEEEDTDFFPTGEDAGYHTAMEWRSVSGGFLAPGPATVWMRQKVPLVAGEEPSPLQRLLVVADVGNGVSAVLDWRRFIFINVDLTVVVERMPEGEWVCVDAVTRPRESGIGSAESELSDRRGRVGRAIQTLLFAER